MSARLEIKVFNAPSEMYDAFCKVYDEHTTDTTHWVEFDTTEGLHVTLFEMGSGMPGGPEGIKP